MDILRILDDLNDIAVKQPKQILGSLYWRVDPDEIGMQIAKVRATLPQEVKQAAQTIRETDRIVGSAKEDAQVTLENARKEAETLLSEAKLESERILEQARLEQKKMVNESEILKLSKAQSEEIRNAAERDAINTRRSAEAYAVEVLGRLEGVVGKAMTVIDRGKQELQAPSDAPVPIPPNRVRVS